MTPTPMSAPAPTETRKELGERVAALSKAGRSDGEVAALTGLSVEIVRRWLADRKPA